jgi:nuclear cap-binding protein subunit 1
MPGIVTKCVLLLYGRVDEMDAEAITVLTDWFVHYISNFDFKWIWTQWPHPSSSQKQFISEVLTRCVRLSYHERIEKALPEEIKELMPPKSRPDFKFLQGPAIIGYKGAQQMYVKLKKEETSEQIIAWLDSPEGASVSDMTVCVIVDIIVCCLLQIGVKGLSSLYKTVAKYLPLLTKYINNLETEKQALQSITQFWHYNSQNVLIAVMKLQAENIISSDAIAEWLFLPVNYQYFAQQWIWELLDNCVLKKTNEVASLNKTIQFLEPLVQDNTASEEEKENYSTAKEKYAAQLQAQKNLFLVIFENFESVLRENIILYKKKEKDGRQIAMDDDYLNSNWIRLTLGQFKAFGRKYSRLLVGLDKTLDVLFSESEEDISLNYEQFKSLITNF